MYGRDKASQAATFISKTLRAFRDFNSDIAMPATPSICADGQLPTT
jgi:hypothetical protein